MNYELPKKTEEITRKAEIFDIPNILSVLRDNLRNNLSEELKKKEGFLSFDPSEEELAEIINDTGVIVDMKGTELKGYFITLSKELARKSNFWDEMLNSAEAMEYNGKKIIEYNYVVMGQICVAKNFRGGTTFNKLHYTASQMLKEEGYEIGIAEIADDNSKSLAVHGFLNEVGSYKATSGVNWHIVVLDLGKD